MQVLEEGLFLLGLAWSWPDARVMHASSAQGDFVPVLPYIIPHMDKPLLTPCRGGEQLYGSKRRHPTLFVAPFPTFVGCADESLAPWGDSSTLGTVISPCVAHLCFEHSFRAHALERESCRADSPAETKLPRRGLEVCNITSAVFCTPLFPEIMPSLLLARSLCSPLQSRRGNLTVNLFVLYYHFMLVWCVNQSVSNGCKKNSFNPQMKRNLSFLTLVHFPVDKLFHKVIISFSRKITDYITLGKTKRGALYLPHVSAILVQTYTCYHEKWKICHLIKMLTR